MRPRREGVRDHAERAGQDGAPAQSGGDTASHEQQVVCGGGAGQRACGQDEQPGHQGPSAADVVGQRPGREQRHRQAERHGAEQPRDDGRAGAERGGGPRHRPERGDEGDQDEQRRAGGDPQGARRVRRQVAVDVRRSRWRRRRCRGVGVSLGTADMAAFWGRPNVEPRPSSSTINRWVQLGASTRESPRPRPGVAVRCRYSSCGAVSTPDRARCRPLERPEVPVVWVLRHHHVHQVVRVLRLRGGGCEVVDVGTRCLV